MKRTVLALGLALTTLHLACGEDAASNDDAGTDAGADSAASVDPGRDGSAAADATNDVAVPGPDSGASDASDAGSDAAPDAAVFGALHVSPSASTITVGTGGVSFQAQISVDGGPLDGADATWTLTGPGSLSASTGEIVTYTPPATLGAVTTATITVSMNGATSAVATITLKDNVDAGATYTIYGRAFNSEGTGATGLNLEVWLGDTAVPSATVKLNGATIAFGGGRYQGIAGSRIGPGGSVDLSVLVPEGEIKSSIVMPDYPVITAPTASAAIPAGNLLMTWSNTTAGLPHRGGIGTDPYEAPLASTFSLGAGVMSHTFNALAAGKSWRAYVIARKESSTFTGPIASGSSWTAESVGPGSVVNFTTNP